MCPNVLVSELLRLGIADESEILPVTEECLAELEKELSRKLPAEYRAFLGAVGNGAGQFWADLDFKFEQLESINAEFRNDLKLLLEDGYDVEVPESAFAIVAFRGEHFLFIDLEDSNENCAIYDLNPFTGSIEMVNESLNDRLASCLREFEDLGSEF